MKVVFNKSNLPFLTKLFNKEGDKRDYWTLARRMSDNDTFTSHSEREEFLLQKGAYSGDIYAMCELARYIFNAKDNRLPQALSWWHKATRQSDYGATYDVQNLPIEDRIINYSSGNSPYADIEIKCAMLTEYFLTDLGICNWNDLTENEQITRCEKLLIQISKVLGIIAPTVCFEDNPSVNDEQICDGMACPNEWVLKVRYAVLYDYERLIQVLFHELGHFVVFSMWSETTSSDFLELRETYGISNSRADEWYNNKTNPNNENLPATEEDPDTLSYGVWLTWCLYFKH